MPIALAAPAGRISKQPLMQCKPQCGCIRQSYLLTPLRIEMQQVAHCVLHRVLPDVILVATCFRRLESKSSKYRLMHCIAQCALLHQATCISAYRVGGAAEAFRAMMFLRRPIQPPGGGSPAAPLVVTLRFSIG